MGADWVAVIFICLTSVKILLLNGNTWKLFLNKFLFFKRDFHDDKNVNSINASKFNVFLSFKNLKVVTLKFLSRTLQKSLELSHRNRIKHSRDLTWCHTVRRKSFLSTSTSLNSLRRGFEFFYLPQTSRVQYDEMIYDVENTKQYKVECSHERRQYEWDTFILYAQKPVKNCCFYIFTMIHNLKGSHMENLKVFEC